MDTDRVDVLNRDSWDLMLQNAERADEVAAEAEFLSRSSGYQSGLAEALLNRGWTAIYRTAHEEALQYLEEAEAIFREISDQEGLAKTLNAVGVAYHNHSDYHTALETYRRALAHAERWQLNSRTVSVLNNIGEVYLEMNRVEDAEEYFLRSLELLTGVPASTILASDPYRMANGDETESLAVVMANIGSARLRLGNFEQSERFLHCALDLARKINDRIVESEILTLFGVLAAERGEAITAEEFHTESLRVSQKSKNHLSRVNTIIHLGDLHSRLDQFESAAALYRQALDISQEIGSPYLESRACSRLADALEREGETTAALEMYKKYASIRHELLSASAEQKVKALNERIDRERLKVANQRLELINDFAQEVTSTLDLEEIFNRIYDRVNALIDAHVFAIALYDEETGVIDFRLTIEQGVRVEPVQISADRHDSIAAYAVRSRTDVIIGDRDREISQYVDEGDGTYRGKKSQSLVFIPLEVKHRIVGVLSVQSQTPNAYSALDIQLIRTLSSFIAIAIDNALIVNRVTLLNQLVKREKDELQTAYKQISFLANHDSLTGLANRRMFADMLDLSISQAREGHSELAVFFVDLNGFKPVNDTYGHEAGDEVLRVVAMRLKSVLRQDDFVARLGGDEFVGIIRNAPSRETMEAIATKITESIATPMSVTGIDLTVTAAVGVALFPDHGETSIDLIRAADGAMYTGKQKRRDGVTFYQPEETERDA